MRVILLALALFFVATTVSAQTKLACFEEAGYKNVVDKVVNKMQFLNHRLGQTADINFIHRQGCDYNNKRVADALYVDIYQTRNGFIFPIFQVRLGPTQQLMYAADAIFETSDWRVSRRCGYGSRGLKCIVPRNCVALRGYQQESDGYFPRYVKVPWDCSLQ